jgi:hypothetical protein
MNQKLLSAAFTGMKKNILPALVLQTVALCIVLAFYFIKTSEVIFAGIAALKTEYGFIFSAISTALFGGLIPFIYILATKQVPQNMVVRELLFYLVLWAWKGMEVDAFYRLQGIIFGYQPNFPTILQKTIVDQFIYTPLWSAPSLTIAFLWKDCEFSFSLLKEKLNKRLFTFKIPSMIFSTWIVWIPAVSIIYCLPMVLQVPLFNLIICFWTLLLNFISRHNNQVQNSPL